MNYVWREAWAVGWRVVAVLLFFVAALSVPVWLIGDARQTKERACSARGGVYVERVGCMDPKAFK